MVEKKRTSYSYAKLPDAGLGNKLLVWARALAFAHLNDLPLIVSPWGRLKIGPLLRGEKSRRFYFGYFKNTNSLSYFKQQLILRSYNRINEPEIAVLTSDHSQAANNLYVFHKVSHWSDYFKGLKEQRDFIRDALYSMLEEKHRDELATLDTPVIGIHVRLGDFLKLRPGEEYAKVGNARAPLDYYKSIIEGVRKIHGAALPVTIFSDGQDAEIKELLELPNVSRSNASSDITDLLLLSRSSLIVPTPGSTFGYWAGFLSDVPMLHHQDHFHSTVRAAASNNSVYEGAIGNSFEAWPELLKQNIKEIRY